MRILVLLLIGFLMLTACNQVKWNNYEQSTETTTTKGILAQNPNTDIFQLKGIIYSNASNIEWVQQAELTIGEKIGIITKQYKDGLTFEDEMASKLPIGVEIFEPEKKNGPILIIKLNNKEVRYLGLIEG